MSAARRLAFELKLPSFKGAVLALLKGDSHVLVIAAERRWLDAKQIPATYCGYPVEQDAPIKAYAQTNG